MRFTKSIKIIFGIIISAVALSSCTKEADTRSIKEREKISLEAWIKLNKPELLNNYQEEGGYYVEILEGDTNEGQSAQGNNFGSDPLMDQKTCWAYTNMTGRDINGTICLTRDGDLADLCGTFSYSTHYAPYFNYCGDTNMGLLEGSYLAMRHELTLSDEFCALYKEKYGKEIERPYKMRKGSKVRLYLPSSIAYGKNGSNTQGGYEGQYSLDASRPLVLDIEVLGAIKDPSLREEEMVNSYKGYAGNEAWMQATKPESEKTDENDDLKLKGLYYNLQFNPKTDNNQIYIKPEEVGTQNPYSDDKVYTSMANLDKQINEILAKRFGDGLTKEQLTDDNKVTLGGRANVWYIVRFLDGFVVDTNIAEIRTLVFKEDAPECEAFSYSPSDDEGKAQSERQTIGAWYYCIPQMHYGAYGQILTTSGYAYGISGLSGTTTTTQTSTSGSSSYYDALNYYNYYNYYNSYYDYYSPYYNYYDYNYYDYSASEQDVVTTKTISTEVLPYTPLVFTLYVEPYE